MPFVKMASSSSGDSMKKLVLIPMGKWEHLTKQYNIEFNNVQDLSIPIPNLQDKEAPPPPPTPVTATTAAMPSSSSPPPSPPPPGQLPHASSEGTTTTTPSSSGGGFVKGPPTPPPIGAIEQRKPEEEMYVCADGSLAKPRPKTTKKKKTRRNKTDFIMRERLDQLQKLTKQQGPHNKDDIFDKSQPVDNKAQWRALQKSTSSMKQKAALGGRREALNQQTNRWSDLVSRMKMNQRHQRHIKIKK